MAVSTAKLDANRRNAQRCTGHRAPNGKNRSTFDDLAHGCQANTLILQTEDPQALQDRKDAWSECLLPRDDVEQGFIDAAVEYKVQQDRARRAQAARLSRNINNAGVEKSWREQDAVLALGQMLFWDKRGPLALNPYPNEVTREDLSPVRRVSAPEVVRGHESPERLVLQLQSTASGCQWMLDQWSKLRSILDDGLNWQSPDKLKAVRLLGRHPLDAADDQEVLMVFIGCQAMEGRASEIIPEIWSELQTFEREPYALRLAGRGIARKRPKDAAAGRRVLLDIVERAMARIKVHAEAHDRRAEIDAALAADCLSFDDSPEGERLRRYELACGRGIARSLESLLNYRRSIVSGELSVVSGPSSVAAGPSRGVVGGIGVPEVTAAKNEPTAKPKIPSTASAKGADDLDRVNRELFASIIDFSVHAPLRAPRTSGQAADLIAQIMEWDKPGEWVRPEIEKQPLNRAEPPRKLNEQTQNAMETASAIGVGRRIDQKNKATKPRFF